MTHDLTVPQLAVLMQMSGDLAYTAGQISANLAYEHPESGWTPKGVSNTRKELHSLGYADFGYLTDDEGLLRGRGYWLTNKGSDIRYSRS